MQDREPTAVRINWQGVLPGTWGPTVTQAQAAASLVTAVLSFRQGLIECVLRAAAPAAAC